MSAAVDRHAATLARDGWCVFGRAVAPGLIAGIEADLDARFAATPLCQGAFYGERTKRFGSLLTRSPAIERLAMHPLILEIVEQMLLPWCARIALNLTQAIEIHPGALPHPIARARWGPRAGCGTVLRPPDRPPVEAASGGIASLEGGYHGTDWQLHARRERRLHRRDPDPDAARQGGTCWSGSIGSGSIV